jgi:O-antigen ligase
MQIATDRINTIIRWCEYAYVVVLLFTLTQGPVYSLWYASALVAPTTVASAQFLTFMAIQIPAVIMLGYQRVPRSSIFGPVGILGLFCGWMWLSTVWATFGQHTIIESTTLCVTFLTGVYLARSFSLLEQLVLVVVAMQPGLLCSRYAIANNWSNSVDQNGNWVGIYFNRNSLAPVAMVSCLAASALLWIVVMRRGKKWPITLIAILVDVILFGAVMLFHSRSNTSVGGAIVFAAVWAFWTVVRSLIRRKKLDERALSRFVFPSFVFSATVLTWATVRFQSIVLGIFDETFDFNGRSAIWHYSWTGFLERPFIGWGWMSAWRSSVFLRRDLWWSFTYTGWSHSGYMDVLLGGGVVGAALLIGAIVYGGHRHLTNIVRTTAGQWTSAIIFFVMAISTQESFFVGNHFLWALFVAAIAGVVRSETAETQSESSAKSLKPKS